MTGQGDATARRVAVTHAMVERADAYTASELQALASGMESMANVVATGVQLGLPVEEAALLLGAMVIALLEHLGAGA